MKRLRANADAVSAGRTRYRADDVEAEVAKHLQQMLNTRAGASLSAPEYGMVEISDMLHDFPDAMGVMQRAIKNSITKHEPRLRNVQVRLVQPDEDEQELFVHFEISAQLVHPNGDRQPVRFSTSVDESSNVRVT